MAIFSNSIRSLRKSWKLRKLQMRIAPPARWSHDSYNNFMKSLESGINDRKRAINKFLDLCEDDPGVRRVMETEQLSREDLENIYERLVILGLGGWIKGHYAALSSIAYVEPLLYVARSQKSGTSWEEIALNLMQYWEGRFPQGGLLQRVQWSGSPATFSSPTASCPPQRNKGSFLDVRQTAIRVNSLLNAYIAVHNDIFATGIRGLIPIPGIFKRIDYCRHEVTLANISAQLDMCQSEAARGMSGGGPDGQLASVLFEYTRALNATVKQLEHMSTLLCRKMRGDKSYSLHAYKRDYDLYNQLVQGYLQHGAALNRAFRNG